MRGRDGDISNTRQNLCLICIPETLLVKESLKTIALSDRGLSSEESILISPVFLGTSSHEGLIN